MPKPNQITVGAAVAEFLEHCSVKAAFGVISIHNMPILDAMFARGKVRFVMARGRPARAIWPTPAPAPPPAWACASPAPARPPATSAAWSRAYTAGTPLLHITGQIETQYLDKKLSYIHEAPDQLTMLKAVSKAAFRVLSAETCLSTLKAAVQAAMTAPTGPVSVEIPIDIQQSVIDMPSDWAPLPVPVLAPSEASLDALADQLAQARRPLLWLGGGARHAGAAVQRLKAMGFGIVSTGQGRGIVPEDDPASLGATTSRSPSRPSTSAAMPCWQWARACAATRR